MAWSQWQPLLQAWQEAAAAEIDEAKQGEDEGRSRDLGEKAWKDFIAPGSPASALLRALAPAGPGVLRLTLPAELAQLPWLARAVGVEPPEFRPGVLLLEPSVSAWLLARRRELEQQGQPAVFHERQVVHGGEAGSLLGLQAQAVAGALGVVAVPAHGMLELAQALAAPGPAHLVAHGSFEAFDPMRSHFSLNQGATLLAWLLRGMEILGDLSLAACQGMLVGHGGGKLARLAGPAGLGPLLRASGARSVIGSLGLDNQLVSAIFHERWYVLRHQISAAQALAQVQHQIRGMGLKEVHLWIKKQPKDAQPWLLEQLSLLTGQRAESKHQPFEHPMLWARVTLLGDAPPLPPPPHVGPTTSWWGRLRAWVATWRIAPTRAIHRWHFPA